MGFSVVILDSKILGKKCSVHCGCGNRLKIGFAAIARIGLRVQKLFPESTPDDKLPFDESMKIRRFKLYVKAKDASIGKKELLNVVSRMECCDCGDEITVDITSKFDPNDVK